MGLCPSRNTKKNTTETTVTLKVRRRVLREGARLEA